jgi:hypothetical protein
LHIIAIISMSYSSRIRRTDFPRAASREQVFHTFTDGMTFRVRHPQKVLGLRRVSREKLERETGIEPATNGLGSRYSTIELLPLC